MSRKLYLAIFVTLLFAVFISPVLADEESALDTTRLNDSQRTFAPVQGGYSATGRTELPYAPNRLLVQLKSDAAAESMISNLTNKNALMPNNEIGLESLDELADISAVTRVERPYIQVKNKIGRASCRERV